MNGPQAFGRCGSVLAVIRKTKCYRSASTTVHGVAVPPSGRRHGTSKRPAKGRSRLSGRPSPGFWRDGSSTSKPEAEPLLMPDHKSDQPQSALNAASEFGLLVMTLSIDRSALK